MEIELTAPIVQCATDRFGSTLSVLREDGVIDILSGNDLRKTETIQLKNPRPTSIAMESVNSARAIVVGCSNGEVILIKGNTQTVIGEHTGAVLGVAINHEGLIASVSLAGTLGVHKSPESSFVISSPLGLTTVAFSGDDRIVVGGADGVLRLFKYQYEEWTQISAFQAHDGWIRTISIPEIPSEFSIKVASVGDDGKLAITVFRDTIVEAGVVERDTKTPLGINWMSLDNVLVVSYGDNTKSTFMQSDDGEWKKVAVPGDSDAN